MLRFIRKEAQNDRTGRLVILSLRRVWTAMLSFIRKRGQNDRGCGLVILNAVKDLALFTLKILRKRGSE